MATRELPRDPLLSTFVVAACSMVISVTTAYDANAQVCGLGASDSSMFDKVINLPADSDGGPNGVPGETVQTNLAVGGVFGHWNSVGFGSEVNLCGGTIGAYFTVWDEGRLSISGGSVGIRFDATNSSDVEIFGGEFMLNGAPYLDPSVPRRCCLNVLRCPVG